VAGIAPRAIAQGRAVALHAPDSPVCIRANAHAVEDALRNVVENAIVHAPRGSEVIIEVHAEGRVTVADRGRGIPDEHRERVFDRFWRAPGAAEQGAGLGLAIVKEIMQAHGGSVAFAPNPGGGTVFTLAFRLNKEGPHAGST